MDAAVAWSQSPCRPATSSLARKHRTELAAFGGVDSRSRENASCSRIHSHLHSHRLGRRQHLDQRRDDADARRRRRRLHFPFAAQPLSARSYQGERRQELSEILNRPLAVIRAVRAHGHAPPCQVASGADKPHHGNTKPQEPSDEGNRFPGHARANRRWRRHRRCRGRWWRTGRKRVLGPRPAVDTIAPQRTVPEF